MSDFTTDQRMYMRMAMITATSAVLVTAIISIFITIAHTSGAC